MAYSKEELFSSDLRELSAMYKALAHPARLAVLKYLAEIRTCITGDIADMLPLGRTTVNQHLQELKEAGLIKGTTEGVKTCYCLDPDKFKKLMMMSDQFMKAIDISAGHDY
jgi:ArsR family transcriptional regulator, arsenate/arsenite/antimonite-responsive transcriptional repressor